MNNPLITKSSFVLPDMLFMSIQLSDRLHKKIATISPHKNDDNFDLEYCLEDQSFKEVKDLGFKGYPSLEINKASHDNIYHLFEDRVISKKRADYNLFLDSWRISEDLIDQITPLYVLGLTGGAMPGDPFYFFPYYKNWTESSNQLSFITLIHRFSNQSQLKKDDLTMGMEIAIKEDKNNKCDKQPIYAFVYDGIKIGYVSRMIKQQIHDWKLSGYHFSVKIARFNGSEEKPCVFANILVETHK